MSNGDKAYSRRIEKSAEISSSRISAKRALQNAVNEALHSENDDDVFEGTDFPHGRYDGPGGMR